MQLNRNSGLALLLIGFGILTLFSGFGLGIGKFMGIIIPAVIMFLGYIGIKQGKSIIGWSLFIIGFVILLGKFAGLLGLIISVGLIIFGISLLKKGSKAY
jgi:lia operon protein LiaI